MLTPVALQDLVISIHANSVMQYQTDGKGLVHREILILQEGKTALWIQNLSAVL